MTSIKFNKNYEVIYSKAWNEYKGLPNLREDTHHGHQMTKRDLTRVPMIRKSIPLT